jgi:hypothetical protein|tara:strand:- start:23812 stop:24198 length:387 start_codon:yes stop_codon:yes gene_type:complete
MNPQSKHHIFTTLLANPKLLKVDGGWATFTIKMIKGLKSGKSTCWGTCDFDTYEIHLDDKMADEPARETLLHEICHILLEFCGLGGNDIEEEESIKTSNERLTITMSRAMMMFARLNPELAKELLCLN